MSKSQVRIDLFSEQQDILGEGPLWSSTEQALYWLDIARKVLYRRGAREIQPRQWILPEYPGCLAEISQGSIAVAMGAGLHRLDLETSLVEPLCQAPTGRSGTRFNDGKVDARGRFWAGTMQNNLAPDGNLIAIERADGVLYRFDSGCVSEVEENLGIPNTVTWSPDSKRFYLADSLKGKIFVYDFDVDSGSLHGKRPFFEGADYGIPDGSAIDVDGCLWNARWDAAAILRITPAGRLDRVIEMPVARPTSCVFGGPGLGTLFVTSARLGLAPTQLAQAPLSGSVFAISGIGRGLAGHCFGGYSYYL